MIQNHSEGFDSCFKDIVHGSVGCTRLFRITVVRGCSQIDVHGYAFEGFVGRKWAPGVAPTEYADLVCISVVSVASLVVVEKGWFQFGELFGLSFDRH